METPTECHSDRIPRPQRVLNPGRLSVPTVSALLKEQVRKQSRSETVPATRGSAPVRSPATTDTSSHAPSRTTKLSLNSSIISGNGVISTEKEPPQHSALERLGPMVTLGVFTQDKTKWTVRAQRGRKGLIMIKRLESLKGQAEIDLLRRLSHRNITKLIHSYVEDEFRFIAMEYCRFTIAEVLHVHLHLEEPQLHFIARSVFDGLSYLEQHGIVHNHINARSIRITTPEIKVVISDFEVAKARDDALQNKDLTDLGLVLLDCMEGHVLPTEKRHIDYIDGQRKHNKVFGLSKAELWSGSKQLIDFLDELFNRDRTPHSKFARPHKFVHNKREDPECLRPYVELVTLECYTVWEGGQGAGTSVR